ncbi:uncharacterized protein LOC121595374 [Anopheles merus]|uniref:uncharacterized protein LOC121595374 n=1 Tax=Anopheles merus TaxID=30066 RepID=UPI001BE3EA1F|nr:uncharacterized protein LOC121595374 [Anopheles merus]
MNCPTCLLHCIVTKVAQYKNLYQKPNHPVHGFKKVFRTVALLNLGLRIPDGHHACVIPQLHQCHELVKQQDRVLHSETAVKQPDCLEELAMDADKMTHRLVCRLTATYQMGQQLEQPAVKQLQPLAD